MANVPDLEQGLAPAPGHLEPDQAESLIDSNMETEDRSIARRFMAHVFGLTTIYLAAAYICTLAFTAAFDQMPSVTHLTISLVITLLNCLLMVAFAKYSSVSSKLIRSHKY